MNIYMQLKTVSGSLKLSVQLFAINFWVDRFSWIKKSLFMLWICFFRVTKEWLHAIPYTGPSFCRVQKWGGGWFHCSRRLYYLQVITEGALSNCCLSLSAMWCDNVRKYILFTYYVCSCFKYWSFSNKVFLKIKSLKKKKKKKN